MKDIKDYIIESNYDNDLYEEIGLALSKFGNTKNGFKAAKKQDIIDAMYKAGFDYDEENSTVSVLSFTGEYIDDQYDVNLYIDKENGEYITLKNFKVFKS